MDTYQNFKNRVQKNLTNCIFSETEELSLFNFTSEETIVPAREEDLVEALCSDFKRILEIEDLSELIHEVFKIENQIQFLKDKGKNVPDLLIFYQNLSPVLLRSLWEVLNDGEKGADDILLSWKEAIRIAIEEEFYVWQEKIIS